MNKEYKQINISLQSPLMQRKRNKNSCIQTIIIISIIFIFTYIFILCYNKSTLLTQEKQCLLTIKTKFRETELQENDIRILQKRMKEKERDTQNYNKHLSHLKNSHVLEINRMNTKQEKLRNSLRQNIDNLDMIMIKINNANINKELITEIKRLEFEIEMIQNKTNLLIATKGNLSNRTQSDKTIVDYKLSNILTPEHDIDLIRKWINYKGGIELELLFQSSRDGRNNSAFHLNCDYIKNTLVLFKSDNNVIIGGYTEKTWEGYGYKKDPKAFIFNLNKKKMYKVKHEFNAIFANPEYMISFGFSDIFINEVDFWSKFPQNYGSYSPTNELTDGKEILTLKEMEVYKIKFDKMFK